MHFFVCREGGSTATCGRTDSCTKRNNLYLWLFYCWWCMVGCGFHSNGGSSFTPSTCPHIPDSSSTSCPPSPSSSLSHIIAPLNTDNCWQMDCTACCVSVAPGDSGRLGAVKGRAKRRREQGVLAAARRLAQVVENQYWSGSWLGLTAQEQWSVGILCVPPTASLNEAEKAKGRKAGEHGTQVIPHLSWHFDNETRTQWESMQV